MSRATRVTRPLSVVLAALVLIGGANLAAYAATGGKFILGFTNKANQATTLTNTGTGPALNLNARAGSPALAVSNENKIAKLNADKVDGLDSSDFAPTAHVHDDRYYTEAELDQLIAGKAPYNHVHDERYYLRHDIDHMFAAQRIIKTGNGVGNDIGCTSGLEVQITDGLRRGIDDRFTFYVPGASNQAWGQIRADGSIRTSSSNVTSVSRPTTGGYCVQISGSGFDLEGAVVSMHTH